MKKIFTFLISIAFFTTLAFGVDKIINAPSGYLKLTASDEVYTNKNLGVKVTPGSVTNRGSLVVQGTQGNPSPVGTTAVGILQIRGGGSHNLFMGTQNTSPFGSWIQAQDSNTSSGAVYPLLLNPSGGKVIVGSSTALNSSQLTVGDTTLADQSLTIASKENSGTEAGYLYFADAGSSTAMYLKAHHGHGRLKFTVNDATDMVTFDGNSRVGFGTTSPGYKVSLVDSGEVTLNIRSSDQNGGSLRFNNTTTDTSGAGASKITGTRDGATNSGILTLYTANTSASLTQRMVIKDAGTFVRSKLELEDAGTPDQSVALYFKRGGDNTNSCNTLCSGDVRGMDSGSGVCIAAWNSSDSPVTCSDTSTTYHRCLCAGSQG